MRLPLNPNILICRLRGVRVKPFSYAKILLINPMPLAPILIKTLSNNPLIILLKTIVNSYTTILRVRVYNI